MGRRISVFATTVLLAVVLLGLVACAAGSGQPLKDIHTEGELDNAITTDSATCFSCHIQATIVDATKGYGSDGLNIHNPPESMMEYYGTCVACHQVEASPVVTCNSCHDFKTPKGWENP